MDLLLLLLLDKLNYIIIINKSYFLKRTKFNMQNLIHFYFVFNMYYIGSSNKNGI
jgi:hypothetical protein